MCYPTFKMGDVKCRTLYKTNYKFGNEVTAGFPLVRT
jgi:hypothetical protein